MITEEKVHNALYSVIDPEKYVMINLVWDPPWTPERLTDQAREMLRW